MNKKPTEEAATKKMPAKEPPPKKEAVKKEEPLAPPPREIAALLECPLPPDTRKRLCEYIIEEPLGKGLDNTIDFARANKLPVHKTNRWLNKFGINSDIDLFWILSARH